MRKYLLLFGAISTIISSAALAETSLTIATVNNGDMIRMQRLADDFTTKNPDIKLNWITLEENVLRERVTTDIATKGGQYDILTIGTYEAPIWAKRGWLLSLDKLDADFDKEDILPTIREALSTNNKLFASPFYAESSLLMYRKDLFDKAGLKMPEGGADWQFISEAARKIDDKKNGIAGICMRGKAGWGENMVMVTSIANTLGAKWFDENWKPQFNTEKWKEAARLYVNMLREVGPGGASSNGFNENLALFQQGKCGMWIDASVAASFVSNPKESRVANEAAFALPPNVEGGESRGNWLWAWALAIPSSSSKSDAAQKFISWATNKDYLRLVASKEGWANVPPGTRKSLYDNPEYLREASFAAITSETINAANKGKPKVQYSAWGYLVIPEYQNIGTAVGQLFSAAVAGQLSVDDALAQAQSLTTREMTRAGYIK
ncbi:ABC transporter substrate-binding protein [Pseudomonas putida]|uniref:ABC transporter substrate-binding protein n=1 Tax=Pseudomonas putida TaxID=303 RepID=UPI0023637D26|nr:sugar ABC transporter substrate-binding protein [Pseudomonas putida]MDD2001945.1 sugar ABC transporter substrate-binding protein [Pseudomonas putida]